MNSSALELDPSEDLVSPVSREIRIVFASMLVIIFLIGVSGNLLVLYAVCRWAKLRQAPKNIFLVALSAGNLLISSFGIPLPMVSSIAGRWVFGQIGCQLYMFSGGTTGIAAIYIMGLISFERCFKVLRTNGEITRRGAVIGIVISWAVASLVMSLPFFGINRFVLESSQLSCSLDYKSTDPVDQTYTTLLLVIGFALPLTITLASWRKMWSQLRKMKKKRSHRQVVNTTNTTLIMIILYMGAWTPYAVSVIADIVQGSAAGEHTLQHICAAVCAKMSVIFNPIIFVLMNTEVKNAIFAFFHIPIDTRVDNKLENQSLESGLITGNATVVRKSDTSSKMEMEQLGISN